MSLRQEIIALGVGAMLLLALWTATRLIFVAHDLAWPTRDDAAAALLLLAVASAIFGYRRSREATQDRARLMQLERHSADLARNDPLTGLMHRQEFLQQLTAMLYAHENGRIAVLVFDIAGYRDLAQQHGPVLSDRILRDFSQRVRAFVAPDHLFAYLGDDDFVIAIPKVADFDAPTRLARQIILAAEEPVLISGRSLRLGVNIGMAMSPEDGRRADELIRRATLTLYRTRKTHESTAHFFDPEMDLAVDRNATLRALLPKALTNGELSLEYQPIITLADNRIVAFEALARWNNDVLGSVSPDSFFSTAIECGLLRELNDVLLRQACRDARQWPETVNLSYNLDSGHFRDRALGLHLVSILKDERMPVNRIVFEIEAAALRGEPALSLSLLNELRQMGASIALSGSGARSASLVDIATIPFDRFKLAPDIVQALPGDAAALSLARNMIHFAHMLGIRVAAQGIETAAQYDALKEAGCDSGQGFYFARPVAAHLIPALLRRHDRKPAAKRSVRRTAPSHSPKPTRGTP